MSKNENVDWSGMPMINVNKKIQEAFELLKMIKSKVDPNNKEYHLQIQKKLDYLNKAINA